MFASISAHTFTVSTKSGRKMKAALLTAFSALFAVDAVRPLSNARNAQIAQFRWTTDHHDNRNSRNTNGEIGPAEATGTCPTPLVNGGFSQGFEFFSAGITSIGDGWWFGGDNNNVFWQIEDLFGEEWLIFNMVS